ncbi:hypothetical protein HY993_01680 [Candidatus Micrarchaeota archaeon]|nr:hypothetical protein [Candidatus Micrarchaeota archaeon]
MIKEPTIVSVMHAAKLDERALDKARAMKKAVIAKGGDEFDLIAFDERKNVCAVVTVRGNQYMFGKRGYSVIDKIQLSPATRRPLEQIGFDEGAQIICESVKHLHATGFDKIVAKAPFGDLALLKPREFDSLKATPVLFGGKNYWKLEHKQSAQASPQAQQPVNAQTQSPNQNVQPQQNAA